MLKKEDTTSKILNGLETKVSKLKANMENMDLQLKLQNLLLKQFLGSGAASQTLEANKEGECSASFGKYKCGGATILYISVSPSPSIHSESSSH